MGNTLDPGFHGMWNEDIAEGNYGSYPAPRMQRLMIGPNGLVSGMIDATGQLLLTAVAIGPDGTCTMIASPPGYSSELTYPGPGRAIWTVKVQGLVVQTFDANLAPDGATINLTARQTLPGLPPNTIVSYFRKVLPAVAGAKG